MKKLKRHKMKRLKVKLALIYGRRKIRRKRYKLYKPSKLYKLYKLYKRRR